jgi:hypothetical protein
MFHSDSLPILHENSKRVTVASKLVSRNDSGDIRTLLLTDLSAYKVISDFYRSKLSGWASARTSILRIQFKNTLKKDPTLREGQFFTAFWRPGAMYYVGANS